MSKRAILYQGANNVRTVISDVKIPKEYTVNVPQDFMTDLVTVNNYYPFGMVMPGRSYSSDSYRYGFQGQEKDDEIKGSGNSINYKYRMHDPRLGRFLSVDPLSPDYPWNSPYAFSENTVIDHVELEGLEKYAIDKVSSHQNNGETFISKVHYQIIASGVRAVTDPKSYITERNVRGVEFSNSYLERLNADGKIYSDGASNEAFMYVDNKVKETNQSRGSGTVVLFRRAYLGFDNSKGSNISEVSDQFSTKSDSYKSFVNSMVKMIIDHPGLSLEVVGRASEIGSSESNISLANSRAEATKNFLINYASENYDFDISSRINTSVSGDGGISTTGEGNDADQDRGVIIGTTGSIATD